MQFPAEVRIGRTLLRELRHYAGSDAAIEIFERHGSKVELRDDIELALVEAAVENALAAVDGGLVNARVARKQGDPKPYVQLQRLRRGLIAFKQRFTE